MRKVAYFLIAFAMMSSLILSGCGSEKKENSNQTTVASEANGTESKEQSNDVVETSSVAEQKKENEKLSDVDFIVNVGKALDARWELSNSKDYSDEAFEKMTSGESVKASTELVESEINVIGDLSLYEFADDDLREIAECYVNALELQLEGAKYRYTDNYEKYDETWGLGYNIRCVCINKLYEEYGLTVDKKNQAILEDFISEAEECQRSVDLRDFIINLPETIEYVKDEENSDEYELFYTAIIENTTNYEINSIDINVNFLDKDGIIVCQDFDYIQNLKPGAKIRSQVCCFEDIDKVESVEVVIDYFD